MVRDVNGHDCRPVYACVLFHLSDQERTSCSAADLSSKPEICGWRLRGAKHTFPRKVLMRCCSHISGQMSRARERAMIRYFGVAAILITPAVAMAQNERERGDKACRADVQRLCKSVLEQGDMAILACLQTNRPRLSGTCTKFLQEVGQLN